MKIASRNSRYRDISSDNSFLHNVLFSGGIKKGLLEDMGYQRACLQHKL